MNPEPEKAMTRPPSPVNDSVDPVRHLDELDVLLIDAEADDEAVQQMPPVMVRAWLLLLGMVLVELKEAATALQGVLNL